MGGMLAPSNVISGSVLSPSPNLSNAAQSGLYSASGGTGIGTAFASANYQLISGYGYTLGPIISQPVNMTQVAGSPFVSSDYPNGVAVSPDGLHVVTFSSTSSLFNVYSRNAVSGVLTQITGSPFVSAAASAKCRFSGDGAHLYVTQKNDTLSVYSRNVATGVLTFAFNYGVSANPIGVCVSSDGNSVYVATSGGGFVYGFSRNIVTGALTPIAGSPYASGVNSWGVDVSPDGKFVACGNSGGARGVYMYSRDTVSGALTSISGSPFYLNVVGQGVKFTPDSSQLICCDALGGAHLHIFAVNVNGNLNALSSSPVACISGNMDIAISRDGTVVCAPSTGGTGTSAYSRDPLTGNLTQFAGSPFANGGVIAYAVEMSPLGDHVILPNANVGGGIGVSRFYTTISAPLLSALFSPSGNPNGSVSINGTLSVTGNATLNGNVIATLPSITGKAGKFLRTDGATTLWDNVSQFTPVAMVANAGSATIVDSGIFMLEVTGVLTATGALTVSITVAADPFVAMVDNKCTGAFPLVWNGTYTMPPGKSLWYWDGIAAFEMISQNVIRAQAIAMVANAASLILYDQANNYVDVSGVLTATGNITTTFPANATQVTFDNVTTGAFALQINAGTYTLPVGKSVWMWNGSVFEIVSSFTSGTWTPNQGAGLTVVGAFGSSGTYSISDGIATVTGFLYGATSIAVNAGGIVCTNMPALCGTITSPGPASTGNFNTGGIFAVGGNSTILFSAMTVAPNAAGLLFTATYVIG
jgi:DNA-binding beta-propeller fold protein YncE